ncbi:pilin [Patescibacteria group bacterium]|nr:pilin [Patescibacteria group bacterium]
MLKLLPKILIIIFFSVFIIQLAGLIFLLAAPEISQAADIQYAIDFKPQVGIDTTFQKDTAYAIPKDTKAIGEYIKSIYKYAIGAVGILAAVVLMFGGIIWITAGGSAERIGEAKAWITASLTGLILALCSYMILYTVNPQLVNFKITDIKQVAEISLGRCITAALPEDLCENNVTEDRCIKNNKKSNRWEKGMTCPTACCAWELYIKANIACAATPGCMSGGELYVNCEEKNNLTKANCNSKPGATSYMRNSTCVRKSFLYGTTDYLTSYRCEPK